MAKNMLTSLLCSLRCMKSKNVADRVESEPVAGHPCLDRCIQSAMSAVSSVDCGVTAVVGQRGRVLCELSSYACM